MTITPAPIEQLLMGTEDQRSGLLAHIAGSDDVVCLDRTHVAVDRVCTTCRALHLPTMEQVRYCACEEPDFLWKGRIVVWKCQNDGCGLPILDVLRGRLPEGKDRGTISVPCHPEN